MGTHRLLLVATALAVTASPSAYADPPAVSVEVRDLVTDYSWGYETGLKQHLGSFKNGRSVHAISRQTRLNPDPGLPPLGSPDFLVWVDENTGEALAIEHPAAVFDDGVNPGGNVTFTSDSSEGEQGRLWWVFGGRANELPFDLARSNGLFDPHQFDVVADDFYTVDRSTAPTLSVTGQSGLLVFRHLHSTNPNDAVLFHHYNLNSLPPMLEATRQLGRASSVNGLGDVTIEQVWSRWDPRRRALAVTWQWYARLQSGGQTQRYFGSNPFVYTDDSGQTWRLADGSPATLPLTYADTGDPRLAPHDHIALRQSTKWFTRDIGFAPDGTPWMLLPVGDATEMRFFFWGPSGWESRTLSTDIDEGDPIGCGVTRDYVVCSYSENQRPGDLLLRYSGDNGRNWGDPVVVDSVERSPEGSLQRIDWVSFVQPADGYPDNAARFFVGYYKSTNSSEARRFKNNIRWVRLEIGGSNSNPALDITSPIDGERYLPASPIELAVTTSDPDGDPVQVNWTANGSPISLPWTPAEGRYRIVARATDGNGGAATDEVSIDVGESVIAYPPNTPVMYPPEVRRTTATLSWGDVLAETGYEIGRWKFHAASQTCQTLVIFRTTSADVTTTKNTIKKGGTYCYAVRAFNASGASGWSNTVQVTLRP